MDGATMGCMLCVFTFGPETKKSNCSGGPLLNIKPSFHHQHHDSNTFSQLPSNTLSVNTQCQIGRNDQSPALILQFLFRQRLETKGNVILSFLLQDPSPNLYWKHNQCEIRPSPQRQGSSTTLTNFNWRKVEILLPSFGHL